MDQRGGGSSREVEQLRQRAHHQHARSDRPRLGPDFRAPARAVRSRRSRSSTPRSRSRAPISWPSISFPIPSSSSSVSSRRPTTHEIVRAEYEAYARNALVQLRRVREGTQIEEDHMRNRQMIVGWLMANSAAIEVRRRDGKTYYVDGRCQGLPGGGRAGCWPMFSASRPKGTTRRRESCSRPTACTSIRRSATRSWRESIACSMPSYTGFVQPRLDAERDGNGTITDVRISYPQDLTPQMLEYSGKSKR